MKLSEIDTKTPGWRYTYAYPNDCVMARKIYNEDNTWCILWKNREGNFDQVLLNDNTKALVCNHKDAYLEYTYDVKDAALFTADFARALSYFLASDICVPLTGSETLAQQMANEGVGILQEAKFTMMGERSKAPDYPCKYFRARW